MQIFWTYRGWYIHRLWFPCFQRISFPELIIIHCVGRWVNFLNLSLLPVCLQQLYHCHDFYISYALLAHTHTHSHTHTHTHTERERERKYQPVVFSLSCVLLVLPYQVMLLKTPVDRPLQFRVHLETKSHILSVVDFLEVWSDSPIFT